MRVQETTNAKLRQNGTIPKEYNGAPMTVEAVYILDKSGSMAGAKYTAATSGIDEDIQKLKEVQGINYLLTVISFSSGYPQGIVEHCFRQPINQIEKIRYAYAGGGTPLNQTVGETIDRIERMKGDNKVIMNIFTDGEENTSSGQYINTSTLQARIKSAEANGFTITFQGTQSDINRVVKEYGIHLSNTLAHDNTAESIREGSKLRSVAMMHYSKAVMDGEAVTENFYTKTTSK